LTDIELIGKVEIVNRRALKMGGIRLMAHLEEFDKLNV
jgi:hypothetical protein